MIGVYRKLRETSKVEKVGDFLTTEEADDVIIVNADPSGGWLYFREQTEEEKDE